MCPAKVKPTCECNLHQSLRQFFLLCQTKSFLAFVDDVCVSSYLITGCGGGKCTVGVADRGQASENAGGVASKWLAMPHLSTGRRVANHDTGS
eukprot:1121053-Rhodomonas_salina.2